MHGDGNCTVEFHNRRWLNPHQPVVEQRDLAPVRGRRRGTLCVNCSDSRLQGVSTETVRSKSALGEIDAFGDLISIPQGPILPVQKNQLSLCRTPSGATRFLQQHETQQAHNLGFGEKVEHKSTQTDRFAAQFSACCFR